MRPASDADCEQSFNTIHYWMDTTDTRFQINSTTGLISLKENMEIDYDPPVNDRTLTFMVGTFTSCVL